MCLKKIPYQSQSEGVRDTFFKPNHVLSMNAVYYLIGLIIFCWSHLMQNMPCIIDEQGNDLFLSPPFDRVYAATKSFDFLVQRQRLCLHASRLLSTPEQTNI